GRPRDRDIFAFVDVEMHARQRVCLYVLGIKNLFDSYHSDQGFHSSAPQNYSRRIRSLLSQRVISERITWSPSFNPPSISIALTELRPSFTCARVAVPSACTTNIPIVLFSCPNAGRPTNRTFASRCRSIVPSTLRSGRAPSGSSPSSDTSTVTVPFCTAGSIRVTCPGTTPLWVSTCAG